MIRNRVVVFTDHNATLFYTDDLVKFEGKDNCVINPDLKAVRGVPPHLWKIKDGAVVPMTSDEKAARLSVKDTSIVNPTLKDLEAKRPVSRYKPTGPANKSFPYVKVALGLQLAFDVYLLLGGAK